MKIIKTANLSPYDLDNPIIRLCVYNGLDCAITGFDVLEALLPQLSPTTRATYEFSKSLQGPILDMNSRGILIDEERRKEVVNDYRETIWKLTDQLNKILQDGVGFEFEVSKNRKWHFPSNDQLAKLFYEVMGLTPSWKVNSNGERVWTVDRKALEKLEQNFYAEPIVGHLLVLRDLTKKVSVLETAIDSDGRIRTTFNIAGTNTGRFASSFSDFGTGTNLQNIENKLRSIFIADPGYKLGNIDLEQSDSRAVGAIHWNLFRDPRYLNACESGDLHTSVARVGFPEVRWAGDLVHDRALADAKFYRHFSYRDASKRLGHGTNFIGQPEKMARETHIPLANIKAFQPLYLKQFPAFPLWWDWTERTVRETHKITTLLGRQRYFFGRTWPPDHPETQETIRAAVAYEPQSITADTINRGLLSVWLTNKVQLLLQVHDSILFQYPEEQEDEIIPAMIKLVEQKIILKEGREFTIPAEAKVGWNWADYNKDSPDPDSLKKFNDRDRPKVRTRN